MTTKEHLRAIYLKKRKALSKDELEKRSVGVLTLFKGFFELKKSEHIHIFLPIEKQNEVNTWPIVDYLNDRGKKVVVSKSDLKKNKMLHFLLDKTTPLEVNKWGIPEPIGGQAIDEFHIDLVLVPLLVFDKSGHRVGYGKGYYDKFLSKCRQDCLKVGISLASPIDEISGIEDTDIRLDYCISPMGLHTFVDK